MHDNVTRRYVIVSLMTRKSLCEHHVCANTRQFLCQKPMLCPQKTDFIFKKYLHTGYVQLVLMGIKQISIKQLNKHETTLATSSNYSETLTDGFFGDQRICILN
jgi:hypothetical protein